MEGSGGCCIARCATTGAAYDMSKFNRIMLRFRPIAPKPGSFSDGSSSENGETFSRTTGVKRKHRNNNTGNKRCSRVIRRRKTAPPPAVTLPLLPETPDPKDPPETKSKNSPAWLSFENHGSASAAKVDPVTVGFGGSVVTVESITDTWQEEGEGLEKMKLGEDTCPGFISDAYGRVTWTNESYKEMVGGGVVWLVINATVPYSYYRVRGFTCRVRVQYACGKERTVPCDVWRMDNGGFAWRLDVTAALTLSLAL